MADEGEEGKGRGKRLLALGGSIIGVIASALGLLFLLQPGLKPCLGDIEAEFTGAPIFPRVGFREHLVRSGMSFEEARQEPAIVGAEIRFSFRTSGLRGHDLPVTYSLISVEKDGTLGAVAPDQDRALAMTVRPDECTETGGKDLFLTIPQRGRRYLVVLELYRDKERQERLALLQSESFRG